ncbi:RNA-binding protein 8A, partial [Tremellales sp. Uapishka_1]
MADVEMNGKEAGDSSWAARCLNEETTEEDLQDLFGDFGEVKNLSLALNRRSGYVMGYALIEYALRKEAEDAIKATTGTTFLEKTIHTDFAFSKAVAGSKKGGAAAPRRTARERSTSPGRR